MAGARTCQARSWSWALHRAIAPRRSLPPSPSVVALSRLTLPRPPTSPSPVPDRRRGTSPQEREWRPASLTLAHEGQLPTPTHRHPTAEQLARTVSELLLSTAPRPASPLHPSHTQTTPNPYPNWYRYSGLDPHRLPRPPPSSSLPRRTGGRCSTSYCPTSSCPPKASTRPSTTTNKTSTRSV